MNSKFMSRAIALALKAKGQTSPNPIVGAVLVKNGKILAEGFHKKAGSDHAEIVALKKLRKGRAKGSILYVTLEPCCHHDKKTPPCVERIVKTGISCVVIGAKDPNPKVSGRGILFLKKAGVKVVAGVLGEECRRLNPAFEKWITTGLPLVTLKVAMTLDGKIAAPGRPRQISSLASQKRVHQLRSEVDAILIGAGTLRKDNPRLTVRLPGKKTKQQPMVVVVGGKKPIPKNSKCFKVKGRRVLCVRDKKGRVDLKKLLKKLGRMGVTHLMVEGGAGVYSSFVRQRLADRVMAFIAPKWFGPKGLFWIDSAIKLKDKKIQKLGPDILIEGRCRK